MNTEAITRIYRVEWWEKAEGRYHQEYYSNVSRAADRVIMLEDCVTDSRPEITTVLVDNTVPEMV